MAGKGLIHHRAADTRHITATTPDEIHPQLDPTPILTPLPKPISARVIPLNTASSHADHASLSTYVVGVSNKASLTSSHLRQSDPRDVEVVTLVSRHDSQTSLNNRSGETHV